MSNRSVSPGRPWRGLVRRAGSVLAVLLSLALASPALARGPQPGPGMNGPNPGPGYQGRQPGPGGHSPQPGPRMDRLPPGNREIRWHDSRYYYHGGHYFRPHSGGFIQVIPPFGLIVPFLPPGYFTLVVGGITYYSYLGVYYTSGPRGFVVVEPPPQVVVAAESARNTSGLPSVVVTAQALNVREGPGYEYRVIAVVPLGQTLTVHSTSPDWLYVELPSGRFGWAAKEFTTPAPASPQG